MVSPPTVDDAKKARQQRFTTHAESSLNDEEPVYRVLCILSVFSDVESGGTLQLFVNDFSQPSKELLAHSRQDRCGKGCSEMIQYSYASPAWGTLPMYPGIDPHVMTNHTKSTRWKAKVAFTSAIALLLVSGIAMYFTTARLIQTQGWVIHTLEVQSAVGDFDSAMSRMGRAHIAFLATGNNEFLGDLDQATVDTASTLTRLRELTRDNSKQQTLCDRLERLRQARLTEFQQSILLRKSGKDSPEAQAELVRQGVPIASETTLVTREMRNEEQGLLQTRQRSSHRMFNATVIILSLALISSVLLFLVHYRLHRTEFRARERAELIAQSTEESLRRLTARLLQFQDEERRKFSRELHDSLGQYLAGVKMNLQMYAGTTPQNKLLLEAIQLLDECIVETRTISHLLHPPLLDEAGFASAAKWYVEGFSKRSGIEVKLDIPDSIPRLVRSTELGLFRVLQEGLTNIHRHSGSSRAEIALRIQNRKIILALRDFGRGLPEEVQNTLKTNRLGVGVGLAGMRERVRELGGQMEVQSSSAGTGISVSLPMSANETTSTVSAAD